MKKLFVFLSLFSFSFLIYSCSSISGSKAPVVQSQPQSTNSTNLSGSTYPSGFPSVNQSNQANIKTNDAMLHQAREVMQRIYFKVNSGSITKIDAWGIKQDPSEVLNRIAEFLSTHTEISIVIEGNCDERGTDAYNLALGQQRADAAKSYLVLKGISASRIDTLSNGKSKPIDPQNNEYAWAKNRNDEFVPSLSR